MAASHPKFEINMEDHHTVRQYLKNLSVQNLIELGGALGLSYPRLCNMTPILDEMVRAWLNGEDQASEKGEPTWSILVTALREIGQNGIANIITDNHLKSSAHALSRHVHQPVKQRMARKRTGENLNILSTSKRLRLSDELLAKVPKMSVKRRRKKIDESELQVVATKQIMANEIEHQEAETDTLNESKPKFTFEYLNLRRLSGKEKEQLNLKLHRESWEIMKKFQKLLSATINSLKQNKVPVERILCHLVGMGPVKPVFKHSEDKAFGCMVPDLEEADNIDKVMLCVGKYSSFFCFQMLECIIENVGASEDRDNLAKYKEDFKKYAKRHVFMCPSEICEGNEEDHADIYIALDDSFDDCELNKIQSFVSDLQELLEIPPSFGLKPYRIEVGSLKLTFQLHFSLLKYVFPLTKEQEEELAKLGVKDLWLIYRFSRKMHQETITMAASISQEPYREHNIEDVEQVPTSPVSEPTKTVSSKDIDSSSVADSGLGTTTSEEPQQAPRRYNTGIDSASIAESGYGPSIFSDFKEDSSSLIDSEKATSMKEKLLNRKANKMDDTVASKEPNNASALKMDRSSEQVPTSPVPEPTKTVSSKDIDSASIVDSGHGTTISEEPQQAPRHSNTCIDLASITDSGRGLSIFSDPRDDSLSLIDSEKATSTKEKLLKGKINEMNNTVVSKEPTNASVFKDNSREVDLEFDRIPEGPEFDQNEEQSLREHHKSLHHAAASGDVSKMRHLIEERDCNPAEPGQDGLTPIHIAAQKNQLESVKYLVEEQKVDPHVHDEEELTPLHRACEGGSLEVVCYIIDQLKEYMQLQDIISEKTKTKDIPLHFASMNGHLEVVKHFVSELQCNPNIQGSQGRTALHYATESGNIDIIEFLIKEANCDPSQCTGGTKRTPLHIAAKHGWLKIVKYLSQEQKCDPLCRNSDGDTPLNIAAFKGHLEIVDFFISIMKCDPLHTHGAKYKTPMHNAAQGGHLHVIKHLVNVQKCDPSKCFGEERVTPLHDAARAGKLEIVKFLTQKQKCDPLSKRDDGETPLNEATYGGHLDLVDFFISELKCDPNTPGEQGRIPLHLAVQQGHMHIVKYLVEKQKCDPSYCKGEDKVTPLHVAAFFGRLDMVKYLTLDKRCDPLSRNSKGETALNDAVLKGGVDVVKYFISEMECNPNSKGEKGRVPLHLAAQGGHMELVEYLVEECGCDKQPVDDDHMTPLHLAAMYRHMNIVNYLVHDKHCDSSIQDSYGFIPLHYAVREGHLDIAKYFVEKCKCPLNSKEYRGYTPLKLAEIERHTHIVHYLKTFTSE